MFAAIVLFDGPRLLWSGEVTEDIAIVSAVSHPRWSSEELKFHAMLI
jgi:hypothetical protein